MIPDTAQAFDAVAFMHSQNIELLELQAQARAAERAAETKKEQIEAELRSSLIGRYVIASGQYESESRMLQDCYELQLSNRHFTDQSFYITYVFLSDEAYSFQRERLTPILFGRHREAHEGHQPGGEVSFRLLLTTRFELVDA